MLRVLGGLVIVSSSSCSNMLRPYKSTASFLVVGLLDWWQRQRSAGNAQKQAASVVEHCQRTMQARPRARGQSCNAPGWRLIRRHGRQSVSCGARPANISVLDQRIAPTRRPRDGTRPNANSATQQPRRAFAAVARLQCGGLSASPCSSLASVGMTEQIRRRHAASLSSSSSSVQGELRRRSSCR